MIRPTNTHRFQDASTTVIMSYMCVLLCLGKRKLSSQTVTGKELQHYL